MSGSDPCGHDVVGTAEMAAEASCDRTRKIRRLILITLVLNAAVAVTKAVYGYYARSLSLGADSLHSILDASSNLLALLGLHWSAVPADERHPYGRRKIEILAALGIGVLIVISLAEFAEAAIRSLVGAHGAPRIGWGGFVVVSHVLAVYERATPLGALTVTESGNIWIG